MVDSDAALVRVMAEPLAIAYLNGEFVPLREARVSPLDRAFLYGDSVYEVMPVYGGRVFRFREHFDRLDRSLGELRMRPVTIRKQWAEICEGLVRRNGGGDMYLYVQVVARRGVRPQPCAAARNRAHGVRFCCTAAPDRTRERSNAASPR